MTNFKYRTWEQVRRLGAWLARIGAHYAYQSRYYPTELLRANDVISVIVWDDNTHKTGLMADHSFATSHLRVVDIQWPKVTFEFVPQTPGHSSWLTGIQIHDDVTRMRISLVSHS
jgi:hypothetical protein